MPVVTLWTQGVSRGPYQGDEWVSPDVLQPMDDSLDHPQEEAGKGEGQGCWVAGPGHSQLSGRGPSFRENISEPYARRGNYPAAPWFVVHSLDSRGGPPRSEGEFESLAGPALPLALNGSAVPRSC